MSQATTTTTTFDVRPTAGVTGTKIDDVIRPANGVEVGAGAFAVPVTALLEHRPLGEEGTSRRGYDHAEKEKRLEINGQIENNFNGFSTVIYSLYFAIPVACNRPTQTSDYPYWCTYLPFKFAMVDRGGIIYPGEGGSIAGHE